MKLFLVNVIALASLGANAQGVDFKGSKFGDTTAQFQELQRGFVCADGGDPCRMLAWSTPEGREDATMTYAGETAKGFYAKFDEDKLVSVEVRIRPESFDRVLVGLTGKFGKPKLHRSVVQNRMGVKFDQVSASWSRKDGLILARRYAEDVSSGVIHLVSPGLAKQIQTNEAAANNKAKSDL